MPYIYYRIWWLCQVGFIFMSNLQIRKLRPRKVKWLAPDHSTSNWGEVIISASASNLHSPSMTLPGWRLLPEHTCFLCGLRITFGWDFLSDQNCTFSKYYFVTPSVILFYKQGSSWLSITKLYCWIVIYLNWFIVMHENI